MLSTTCKYAIAWTILLSSIVICSNCYEDSRCKTGLTGANCDQCARGYFGDAPNCEHCGECFDQWEERVQDLKNRTQALLERVKRLLEIGTDGNYKKEFDDIGRKLKMVEFILDNQRLDEAYILNLENLIDEVNRVLNILQETRRKYDAEATDTNNRVIEVQKGLSEMEALVLNLTRMILILLEDFHVVQGQDVDGAYQIILNSQNRSREAENSVLNLSSLIANELKMRREAESTFNTLQFKFNITISQNEANLNAFSNRILLLENRIPGINKLVCASSSTVNSCDQLCGGALCNKCGGASCLEGATTKASNALDAANDAWRLLNEKLNRSMTYLDGMNEAKNESLIAFEAAKRAMEACNFQKSKFNNIAQEIDDILNGIDKFSLVDGARPAEIRTLGIECLTLSILLTPEEIQKLADKINVTISTLSNIELIIRETKNTIFEANEIRRRADEAKIAAENILEIVKQVLVILANAAIEQGKARAAIEVAKADFDGAKADLFEIDLETQILLKIITKLEGDLKNLQERLKKLEEKYSENELYLVQANKTAVEADKEVIIAEQKADEIAAKIREAEEKLLKKELRNGELKDRAEQLKNDVVNIALEVRLRMDLLRELDDLFDGNVKQLKDYQSTVDDLHKQMNQYIKDIDLRAQYYRECQT